MRDVRDQLRDYWAGTTADLAPPIAEHAMTQRIGAGDVRPVQDRPGPESRPSARTWWQQPAVVATAAAAAALILFGGGALLGLRLRSGHESGDQGVTTLVTATSIVPATTPTVFATVITSALEGYTASAFTSGAILAPGNRISAIAVATDGSVWATMSGGIACFDGRNWTMYAGGPGREFNDPQIRVAADGTVWTNLLGAVVRFDGQTWTTWEEEGGFPAWRHINLVASADGSIWAAWSGEDGPGGIARFDGTAWTTWPEFSLGDLRASGSIAAGPDGTVWAAMQDISHAHSGLARWDDAGWSLATEREYTDGETLGDQDLAVDPDGSVWVSTDLLDSPEFPEPQRTEVSRFDGSTWTPSVDNGRPVGVRRMTVTPDGTLFYFSGTPGGLGSFDGEIWAQHPIMNMSAFAAGPDGTLWAVVGDDLVRFTPNA